MFRTLWRKGGGEILVSVQLDVNTFQVHVVEWGSFDDLNGAIGSGLRLHTIDLYGYGLVVRWVAGVARSLHRGRIHPANQLSPRSEIGGDLNVQQPSW